MYIEGNSKFSHKANETIFLEGQVTNKQIFNITSP